MRRPKPKVVSTFKVQATSIKGTKFTIEFEDLDNGRTILKGSSTRGYRIEYFNLCYYKRNRTLRELLFITKFLRENTDVKITKLTFKDLASLISQILEIPRRRLGSNNKGVLHYGSSKKALAYAHAIYDIYH
jgi:hypothetical protein